LDELIAQAPGYLHGWGMDLLGEIGPAAKSALPTLERQLEFDPFDCDAALAILQIDPDEAKRLGLPGLFIICPDRY
jgi:hypothetical protein